MSKALYPQRLKEHLQSARTLCAGGDYVQAGEKVWGALSALVNCRSQYIRRGVDDKKAAFMPLIGKHLRRNPNVLVDMNRLGFKTSNDIFNTAFGLHEFFYGGTSYSRQQLSSRVPFLIELFENLSKTP
jgi:hypothetical protein